MRSGPAHNENTINITVTAKDAYIFTCWPNTTGLFAIKWSLSHIQASPQVSHLLVTNRVPHTMVRSTRCSRALYALRDRPSDISVHCGQSERSRRANETLQNEEVQPKKVYPNFQSMGSSNIAPAMSRMQPMQEERQCKQHTEAYNIMIEPVRVAQMMQKSATITRTSICLEETEQPRRRHS